MCQILHVSARSSCCARVERHDGARNLCWCAAGAVAAASASTCMNQAGKGKGAAIITAASKKFLPSAGGTPLVLVDMEASAACVGAPGCLAHRRVRILLLTP